MGPTEQELHEYFQEPVAWNRYRVQVVGELAELQPAVVLLPNTVWREPALQTAMRGASPRTQFLPAYQFNATVVNTHLTDYAKLADRLQRRASGTPLAEWMANLARINLDNAWRYIAYLEQLIGEQEAGFSGDARSTSRGKGT